MTDKMKRRLAFMLIFTIVGCASTYVPKPGSIEPDIMPDAGTNTTVTLVNAQPSSQIIQIGSAGLGRSLDGNLQQWTDKAIALTAKTLNKKGFRVIGDSAKVLKLAITHARFDSAAGGWGFQCTVHLNVETGDRHRIEFVGQRKDWKYVGSCNKAFTEAISVMLSDENIQTYITQ